MRIVVIGINHKKAPLEIREKLCFRDDELDEHYGALKKHPEIRESFILSTCNRVEVYAAGEEVVKTADRLKCFLCQAHELPQGFLESYSYLKTDKEAIAHLYRVAGGLDSMVLGEPQILGQIRKAYDRARAAGVIGSCLNKAMQDALRVGKKVRRLTGISRGVTSISGVVVEMIRKEPGLEAKKALVIGAGKIGGMTVKKLAALGLLRVTVVNRDRAAAEGLEKIPNVRAADIRSLPRELLSADIVIAATAAPHMVNREMIEALLSGRRDELILVDLGVPRNIDETARGLKGARLFNIDDLSPVIERTIRDRGLESKKAEEIIRDEVAMLPEAFTNDAADCAV